MFDEKLAEALHSLKNAQAMNIKLLHVVSDMRDVLIAWAKDNVNNQTMLNRIETVIERSYEI